MALRATKNSAFLAYQLAGSDSDDNSADERREEQKSKQKAKKKSRSKKKNTCGAARLRVVTDCLRDDSHRLCRLYDCMTV